ncbi:MAG: PQQ-binding-like beta-propeller repeat protein, partial [Planctomycetota bacterium]
MKLHQALALVLLAGPASAQLQSTATARLGPILDQAEPLFARSHPSGGAVACYRTDAFGSGTATVPLVRVDDSGQELWRHELAVQAGPGPLDSLNVSPSGDIFLCTQDEGVLLTPPEGRIHAFDADGAALWSTWPEGRTGGLFQGRVAGFSPSGDLFVMGIDRETGTFTTLLLDDATGDELWRVDAAGASGNLFVGLLRTTTVEGDAIALVQSGFASFAVRVDPSGQIVHDTTVPGFTGLDEVVRTITPASGGETVVTFWDESSTATVVRLDAHHIAGVRHG